MNFVMKRMGFDNEREYENLVEKLVDVKGIVIYLRVEMVIM